MSLAQLFFMKETFREQVRRWRKTCLLHHAQRSTFITQGFLLEPLEPRLLLSATPMEVVATQVMEPAAITVPAGSLPSLDVDLNGQADALSDGIVIIRHLFGFTGSALTTGAVDPAGQRTDPIAIQNYLNSISSALDVDLNQQTDALSDGIMIIRSLFGFTGTALTSGVIDPGGQRTDPTSIAVVLDNLNPAREIVAPHLAAGLQTDTGLSATDTITFNPSITGTIADINQIASFTAGFDAIPVGSFLNVLADLQTSGVFTLTPARLAQIAGGTLADGTHTLHLQATDARGNLATLDRFFTLDTTGTAFTFDLDLASDTMPVGDQQTMDAVVALRGQTEPNAVAELVGLELSTTADQTGTVAFANVPLAIGANVFTVRSTDIAGNQSTFTRTFTRLLPDGDGDGIPDSQETGGPNGGDANNDGIMDSQQAYVVSLFTSANQYVTLVAPAVSAFNGTRSLSNPSPVDTPAGVTFPLGFVDFTLTGFFGAAATVDLLLPAGVTANTYWNYGATSDNTTPHWYEFLFDGTTGGEINGSIVTVHLRDGARGDSDLTVNGSIVDPGGPGLVQNHAPAGADNTITINEDTPYPVTLADFGFTDPNDSPANGFQAVKITALPAQGTLTVNGSPVNTGELVSTVSMDTNAGAIWTARDGSRSWYGVASSADGTKLIAAAQGGQLYTSADSGMTWTARESTRNWFGVASSADGTNLIAGTIGGQLYTSIDSGVTWTARESTRNWLGVASSADGTKLIAAARGGQLYTSIDSGVTWTAREASRNWLGVASSVDGTKLIAADQGGRLYTSIDSGVSWTPREGNRNWLGVASSADGAKLIAADQFDLLYTSIDSGVTWTPRESSRSWFGVASSADGTKLIAAAQYEQLYTSTDSGVTWTARESNQSWLGVASSADGTKLVAAVNNGQLYTSVPQSGLVFTAAVNANGASYARVTFQVQDNGGTANTSVDLDPTPNTMTFNVTPVNDAPLLNAIGNWVINEGGLLTFSVTATDAESLPGTLAFSLANGTSGLVPAGATINSNTGVFSWTPTEAQGPGTYAFDVRVSDGIGLDAETIQVTVSEMNEAPVNGVPAAQTTREDQVLVFTTANGNLISVSDPDNGTLTVTLAVTNGTLILSGTTGLTGLTGNGTGTVSFSGTMADINLSMIGLSYLPTPNFNGGDTLTLTTTDGVAAPARSTVALRVMSMNDAPSGTNKTITINEDAPYTISAADFGFADPDDSPVNSFQAIKITTLPEVGTLTMDGLVVNAGDLISPGPVPAGVRWTARGTLGGVWVAIASSADGKSLITGDSEHNGLIYTSSDSGVTWTPHGNVGNEDSRWDAFASSSDGTKLVAGDGNLGGLYTSSDSGLTWTARVSNRDRHWYGVASSADGTKLIAADQGGRLYTSTDSGVSWTARETDRLWSSLASSADGTKLVAGERTSGGVFAGHLYTSTDSGATWTARTQTGDWVSVASSADGTKLVAAAFHGQLYTSTDAGATWEAHEQDGNWASVASSADGTKLIATNAGFGLYISTDAGVTWTAHEREGGVFWFGVASSADGSKLVAGGLGSDIYTSAASEGLTFTPAIHENGTAYTSFTFQVQDDGGAFNGGIDMDQTPNTITFNVLAANMTPDGTSETFGNLAEETVPDLELVTATVAPLSATVQSAGLAADGSLAYVQRLWVNDFVAASLMVSPVDPDEELVIALPALAGV